MRLCWSGGKIGLEVKEGMMDEREEEIRNPVRERIIRDCAALIPFADDSAKALVCRDVRKLRSLYTGRSQKRVVGMLSRLVDDLGLCRTVEDLPGPDAEVEELRNVSLEVFRGLSEYAGNPLGLTRVRPR